MVCVNGYRVEVRAKGYLTLKFKRGHLVTLRDVILHVPAVSKVSALADKFDKKHERIEITTKVVCMLERQTCNYGSVYLCCPSDEIVPVLVLVLTILSSVMCSVETLEMLMI